MPAPSSSYLALSHPGANRLDQATKDTFGDVTDRMITQQREQVALFFDGTDRGARDRAGGGMGAAGDRRGLPLVSVVRWGLKALIRS
jgi:hypothetical protein